MSTVQSMPVTRDAVNAFIAGWNADSPRAVREAFTPDGRLCDPMVPSWISGEAIEANTKRVLDHYTDVAFTVQAVLESGDDRIAFEWRMTMGFVAPDGRRVPMQLEG